MNRIEEATKILEKYQQNHIKITSTELAEQILGIDFEQLKELYEKTKQNKKQSNQIEPADVIHTSKLNKNIIEKYERTGINEIEANRYAVVIMAGGQGTRLGHNGPKGTFEMELNSKVKSLFEIIMDKIMEVKTKYNVYLNFYIMTSPENNEDTIEYFEKNNYFSYPKQYIKFFKQEQLPLLNLQGKIILGEDGLIKQASNGNGCIFNSMKKNGIIDDMKQKKIKWILISGIDNILSKLTDPLLLGIAQYNNCSAVVKSVSKREPKERSGIFCKKNGRTGIVEYSEVSEEMANLRDSDGELVYADMNIVVHLYNIESFDKILNMKFPYHTAVKKATHIDDSGKKIIPDRPNTYKFEEFIFDSLDVLDNVLVVRGKREENFAPIKNAIGEDSPKTAKKLYEDFYNNNV